MRNPSLCYCCAILLFALEVSGQTPAAGKLEEYSSRAETIQAARKRKAATLTPERASAAERAFIEVRERRILERLTYGIGGLRLRIGGLVTGSGFALGPEYFRDDLADGKVMVRATTQLSTSKYQLYDTEFALPRLANDRAFLSLQARHRNYPQMAYYGPGPDSEKTGRSNYRLEDNRFGFVAGVRPLPHVRLGATGALMQINVGPGTDDRYISTDAQFSPSVTPGILQQTDFLEGGFFVEYDYRDRVGGPRSGGYYVSRFLYEKDIDLERHSHRRLHVELQQYIPFFNERRVIALRARSVSTWKNPRQTMPFYLQPTLGGSDDLRGYRPFRFHGDNALLFNGEYRYEIFAGLDMAIFADAGKVFQSNSQLNFSNLESDVGFGFRFNVRNAVFMRVDVGFSHEGYQVWLKFNNVF